MDDSNAKTPKKTAALGKKKIAKKPASRARKVNEPAVKRAVEARQNKARPPRRPLSTTYKLSLPEGILEEGFDHRWILERPERVMQFEAAWWEPVKDDEGKAIRKPSGGGEWLTLYRIESKYHDQDKKANRQKPINLLVDQAKLTKDRESMEYVPEGHEAVVKYS